MIVVADTSPLNYLVQIGYESLLPALYQRVLVPTAVMLELRDESAPAVVKQWLRQVPGWIEVRPAASPGDASLSQLDPGEREAIQLAVEQHADLLLIDERRGRAVAQLRGLATTGTLGVLLASAERGLINGEATYRQLVSETNFRSAPALEETFLHKLRAIQEKNT